MSGGSVSTLSDVARDLAAGVDGHDHDVTQAMDLEHVRRLLRLLWIYGGRPAGCVVLLLSDQSQPHLADRVSSLMGSVGIPSDVHVVDDVVCEIRPRDADRFRSVICDDMLTQPHA